jgi:hypothetical protein
MYSMVFDSCGKLLPNAATIDVLPRNDKLWMFAYPMMIMMMMMMEVLV